MGASIQGSYGKREKGFLGGLANSNPANRKNEIAGADVTLGKVVKTGATGVVALASADDLVAGVVLKTDALQSGTIKTGGNLTLLKGGSVFVYCETACVKGAKVFARHTANGDLAVGDVRNDLDTDKAVEIAGVFAESLSSAGIVEIEINL